MFNPILVRIVNACTRHAWLVIGAALAVTIVCGVYAVRNFAINTDIEALISPELPWRQREIAFDKSFPNRYDLILVVVDAPTSELASQAANALVERLSGNRELFHSLRQLGRGDEFFARNGILFLPVEEVQRTAEQLDQGSPLITLLATDPSLRGLAESLSLALTGLQRGQLKLDKMVWALTVPADALEKILAARPENFSWHTYANSREAEPGELRRLIEVNPVLDFAALEPGRAASDTIRKAAADLKFDSQYGARVRLTGPVPIADEEFATVQEGAVVNSIGAVILVLVILWLALKSGRIILAVFLSLIVGLSVTAAVGLWMVNALTLISIAFAVLFVGLGVDFGIQFSVRYRAERYEVDDLRTALARAAESAGTPLTLAAAAVAAGFLAFLPTAYRGVAELGLIAGVGMLIAFVTSVTVLPALLKVLNPPGEKEQLGYKWLAPVDRFLDRRRIPIIVITGLVVAAGLPLLYFLRFDFNPLNLRNPRVESIATYLELRSDPNTGASAIQVLAPSLAEAGAVEEKLAKLPQAKRVMSLDDFVPPDQERKLAAIKEVAEGLNPAFQPDSALPAPSDQENTAALNKTADDLTKAAAGKEGPGAAAATRLAGLLKQLAGADKATRDRAEAAFVAPLLTALEELKASLQAQPITLDNLPPELVSEWVTSDGRARVEVSPAGDPNDNETLRAFARAVLAVAPTATGGPISILESGHTIVRAFIEAGFWALTSIALLLWIVLRRFGDVMLTLIPLLLAGVVTMELCVIFGMPLNFANIIALPLLLGLGVAFKIYYIMAWRAGQTDLLQSSLTRAVFWSALTTAVAFGSLWLSSHPGTSSMGKLLALSLLTTMCAAVLFQPVLMGKPRNSSDG